MPIKHNRLIRLILLMAMVIGGLTLQPLPAHAANIVDPSNIYVSNFEGWGTSLAWWANVLGGWSSTNVNAIADLVFGPSNLNINIARYNIGASPSPNTFTQL